MNDLVLEAGEEPRVDTRLLAEHLGLQHSSVTKLVRNFSEDFKQLGILRFQIREITGPGQPEKFALLNEDQCYLLLTYSRNTERVRALKLKLVTAFAEARRNRDLSSIEYLPTYHQLHDEMHRLAAGSKNERFVHMNVNKLVNATVGIESGMRPQLKVPVRSLLVVAQMTASNALAGAHDHHDGYQSAKRALGNLRAAISGPAMAQTKSPRSVGALRGPNRNPPS